MKGTLDQIRPGWSLRYALLLPFILAAAVPIVLDRVRNFPLAAFVALIAAASAVVRSANLTAGASPLGFPFCVPLLIAFGLLIVAVLWPVAEADSARRRPATTILAFASIAIWVGVASVGSISVQRLWIPQYLQWSRLIPPTTILVDPTLWGDSPVAVIGMRSLPLIGPQFQRRVYDDIIVGPIDAWLAYLHRNRVELMVAAGKTGSPDQPGFLQPLPAEIGIAHLSGVCLLSSHGYVHLYGLSPEQCTTTRTR